MGRSDTMKVFWIIVILLAVIAGGFVVVPALAPQVTEKTVMRDAEVTVGDTMAAMNQSELALTMYDYALSANTSDTVILKKKGEMLLKTGQSGEAAKIYEQVLSQDNNDPTALMRMGDSQVKAGNLDTALSYYDAALAITPDDSKILMKKGDTYLLMSSLELQKLQAAAKALAQQPGTPGYQPASSAGQVDSMQSYQNAMTAYQKAMQIDPKLSVFISARVMSATQNQVASYQELLNNF